MLKVSCFFPIELSYFVSKVACTILYIFCNLFNVVLRLCFFVALLSFCI